MKSVFVAISLLCAIAGSVRGNIVIESPFQTNWGQWGSWSRCPFGTYVQAIQIRTEPYQGAGAYEDDTAVNGIRLYCGDPNNINTAFITSLVGEWGNWGNVFSCRSDDRPLAPDGYVTGFQLRVEGPLTFGDDTATDNLRILCNYPNLGIPEQTKEGDGLNFGSWTDARRCLSNQAVCALQTQVEPYQGDSDDTAMNNVRMECCDR
ncbi:vitelline membrane outer layer protein 1 [Folsomia candida]|uniref:Vitelline membrane outer layer protein 1 n=1 Tax=Folsomia candida TaxID=158441 RepID=A0A226E2Q2_FOLCA|nr:vitelline membrane outer layer protein 1 [Folsomia candida]OXA51709.1 Vitelline membrane outer layer protein 1 [Folsomia candida]